jgi:hypothetical protein
MPRVEFELTMTLFKRTKTFLALDHWAKINYCYLLQLQVSQKKNVTSHIFPFIYRVQPRDETGLYFTVKLISFIFSAGKLSMLTTGSNFFLSSSRQIPG